MTRDIDICNGDADGLCAVLQWRLHDPAQATLVTGLKRDIELLKRVQAEPGDRLLVCDISMHRNRAALLRLLEQGARVRYFDHHAVSDVPTHPNLESHLEFGGTVCTSLLMDRHLGGAHRAWALVGAYGDNLGLVADALAQGPGGPGGTPWSGADRARLRWLGEAINYNAYGEEEEDAHIAPALLYRTMARYPDPLEFLRHEAVAQELDRLRRADLAMGESLAPHWENERACVVVLPDAPWSRRVVGALANRLAAAYPARAHAVLKPLRDGGFMGSVRAPLAAPFGAHELCGRFGGAGRAAAAGIDHLPDHDLERFVSEFAAAAWGTAP
jgi:hypothetical protein